MPQLIDFISRLKTTQTNLEALKKQRLEFEVNETFVVDGVGLVLSGIVRSGVVRLNMPCFLGPDRTKEFKNVVVKGIHVSRTPKDEAVPGELACLNIKSGKANEKLVRKEIRRGMVLVDADNPMLPVTEFEAEMQVLHHSTTISVGYEGVLHCGTIQQTVTLKEIHGGTLLRNEDRGLVRFAFKYQPEYVKEGETILLR